MADQSNSFESIQQREKELQALRNEPIKNNANTQDEQSSQSESNEKKESDMATKVLEYDELQMYFGEPYHVTDKITIFQPTLGDIIECGEKKFYSMISTLCANPTSFRLQLWDLGIDWNKISDYELFIQLMKTFTPKETQLLLGDLNLSWFEQFTKKDDETVKLIYIPRDENNQPTDDITLDNAIIIDELVYTNMINYIRTMFDMHPKVEKAKGKATKEAIIDEDRINLRIEQRKNQEKSDIRNKSILYPLISAMVNHPGFKYKKNELKEVGIVEFMDSVKRLQTYESTRALMSGMYSGMLDVKSMDLGKELNWARDLYE